MPVTSTMESSCEGDLSSRKEPNPEKSGRSVTGSGQAAPLGGTKLPAVTISRAERGEPRTAFPQIEAVEPT